MRVVVPENSLKDTLVPMPAGSFRRSTSATYINYQGIFQTAGANQFRYTFNKKTKEFEGALIEPSRQNLLLNSTTSGVSSQSVVIPSSPTLATAAVLSFYGTGSVTVVSGGFSYTLEGKGADERVWRVFSRRSGVFSLTVNGQVYAANLKPLWPNVDIMVETGTDDQREAAWNMSGRAGVGPTSFIPTGGSAVTRAADKFDNLPSDWETSDANLSILANTTFTTETASTYSSITTYSLGDIVKYGFYVYESLIDENLDNTPDESVDSWLKVRPINELAALDLDGDYRSISSGPAFMTIIVNKKTERYFIDSSSTLSESRGATGAGVLGSNGRYVAIASSSSTHSLSTDDSDDRGRTPTLFSAHSTEEFISQTTLDEAFFSGNYSALPVNRGERNLATGDIDADVISVYISPAPRGASVIGLGDEKLYISKLVAGKSANIGKLKNGVSTSVIDYSTKEVDPFGYATLIKRGFSRKLDCPVSLTKSQFNTVVPLIYSLRATPALWIPSPNDYVSNVFIMFGFYKDFDLVIDYCEYGLYNLSLESIVWDSPGSTPTLDFPVLSGGSF